MIVDLQPWEPGVAGKAIVFGGIDNPGVAIWAAPDGEPHHYEVAGAEGIGNFIACEISPSGGVTVCFGDPTAAQDVVNRDPRLHIDEDDPNSWLFSDENKPHEGDPLGLVSEGRTAPPVASQRHAAIKRYKKACPDCGTRVHRHFNHHKGFGYQCNHCGWWGTNPEHETVSVPVLAAEMPPMLPSSEGYFDPQEFPDYHTNPHYDYDQYAPGRPGKGFVLPNGKAATWNIGGSGIAPTDPKWFAIAGPHHSEIAGMIGLNHYPENSDELKREDREESQEFSQEFGIPYEEPEPGWHSPISIDAQGNYEFLNWNDNFRKEEHPAFTNAGLKRKPAEDAWRFSNNDWHITESDFNPEDTFYPANGLNPDRSDQRVVITHRPTRQVFVGQPGTHHGDLIHHHGLDFEVISEMPRDERQYYEPVEESQYTWTKDQGTDFPSLHYGWIQNGGFGGLGKPPEGLTEALHAHGLLQQPDGSIHHTLDDDEDEWTFSKTASARPVVTRGDQAFIGTPEEYHADVYRRHQLGPEEWEDRRGLVHPDAGAVEWFGAMPNERAQRDINHQLGLDLYHGYDNPYHEEEWKFAAYPSPYPRPVQSVDDLIPWEPGAPFSSRAILHDQGLTTWQQNHITHTDAKYLGVPEGHYFYIKPDGTLNWNGVGNQMTRWDDTDVRHKAYQEAVRLDPRLKAPEDDSWKWSATHPPDRNRPDDPEVPEHMNTLKFVEQNGQRYWQLPTGHPDEELWHSDIINRNGLQPPVRLGIKHYTQGVRYLTDPQRVDDAWDFTSAYEPHNQPVVRVDGQDYWGRDEDFYHAEVVKRHGLNEEQMMRAQFGRSDRNAPEGIRWVALPDKKEDDPSWRATTPERVKNEKAVWERWGPDNWDFGKLGGRSQIDWERLQNRLNEQHGPTQSQVIHEWPDGWHVQQHSTPQDVQRIGEMMANCWKNPEQFKQGKPFFTLHDPMGRPKLAVDEQEGKLSIPLGEFNSWPWMSPQGKSRVKRLAEGLAPLGYDSWNGYQSPVSDTPWVDTTGFDRQTSHIKTAEKFIYHNGRIYVGPNGGYHHELQQKAGIDWDEGMPEDYASGVITPDQGVELYHNKHNHAIAVEGLRQNGYPNAHYVPGYDFGWKIAHTSGAWDDYYDDVEAQGIPPIVPWQPGHTGKAFIDNATGQVHHWITDTEGGPVSTGVPHHSWYAQEHGIEPPYAASAWIHPDGQLEFPYLDSELSTSRQIAQVRQAIAQANKHTSSGPTPGDMPGNQGPREEGWKWIWDREAQRGHALPMPTYHETVQSKSGLLMDQTGVIGPNGEVEWYGGEQPNDKIMTWLKTIHPNAHPTIDYSPSMDAGQWGWKFAAPRSWLRAVKLKDGRIVIGEGDEAEHAEVLAKNGLGFNDAYDYGFYDATTKKFEWDKEIGWNFGSSVKENDNVRMPYAHERRIGREIKAAQGASTSSDRDQLHGMRIGDALWDKGWPTAARSGSNTNAYVTPDQYLGWQEGQWGRYVIDHEGNEHRWSEHGPEHWRWIEDHPHLELGQYGYIRPDGSRENYDMREESEENKQEHFFGAYDEEVEHEFMTPKVQPRHDPSEDDLEPDTDETENPQSPCDSTTSHILPSRPTQANAPLRREGIGYSSPSAMLLAHLRDRDKISNDIPVPFTHTHSGAKDQGRHSSVGMLGIGADGLPHPIPSVKAVGIGMETGLAQAEGDVKDNRPIPRELPKVSSIREAIDITPSDQSTVYYYSGQESHMELPGKVVDVDIEGEQYNEAEDESNYTPWYPLIHDPKSGITYRGGEGAYHMDMVDEVPELKAQYAPPGQGFSSIIQQAEGNGNWHGRQVGDKVTWWDKPGPVAEDWHFGSESQGSPAGMGGQYRTGADESAIKIHMTDDPGTADEYEIGDDYDKRRPLLFDSKAEQLYVGGLGQYHHETAESHGLNNEDDYSRGMWIPEGSTNWGYKPGEVAWFSKTPSPYHQDAIAKQLNAQNINPDEWRFGSWTDVGRGEIWTPAHGIEPWDLGKEGKGFFLDGEPHMWALSDQWGGPHHEDVAHYLDPNETSALRGYFHISPDGTVQSEGTGDTNGFANHDPRLKVPADSDWHFGSEESKMQFIHHNNLRDFDKPLSDETYPILGYEGRIPLIYDHDKNIVHVGQPNYSHDALYRSMRAIGHMAIKRGYGWIGYNPESYSEGDTNFGWYHNDPSPDVNQAIADHFGVKDIPKADMSDWHFGNSDGPPEIVELGPEDIRGRNPMDSMKDAEYRRPFAYHPDDHQVVIGPYGSFHSQIDPNRFGHPGGILTGGVWGDSGGDRVMDFNKKIPYHVMQAISEHAGVPIEGEDYHFGAANGPSEGWPEVPDPTQHWQGLKTKSQGWHVWPYEGLIEGAGDPHAVYMHKHNIPFEDAIDFAHYAPSDDFGPGAWKSYTKRYYDDYKDIYNAIAKDYQKKKDFDNAAKPTAEEWHFGAANSLRVERFNNIEQGGYPWTGIRGGTHPILYYPEYNLLGIGRLNGHHHPIAQAIKEKYNIDLDSSLAHMGYTHLEKGFTKFFPGQMPEANQELSQWLEKEGVPLQGATDWHFSADLGAYENSPLLVPDVSKSRLMGSHHGQAVPWQKGMMGKGLIRTNGEAYLWRAEAGDPHHPEVLMSTEPRYNDRDMLNFTQGLFSIEPDGKVQQAFWEQGRPKDFSRLHPDLYPHDPTEDWKFGAVPQVNEISHDMDMGSEDSGRPVIHDPRTNKIYVGEPHSYHWDMIHGVPELQELYGTYAEKLNAPELKEGGDYARLYPPSEGNPGAIEYWWGSPNHQHITDALSKHFNTSLQSIVRRSPNEEEWKFGAFGPEPWSPGEMGKGGIVNGEVHHWRTDNGQDPTHHEVLHPQESFGNIDWTKMFWIHPEGHVRFWRTPDEGTVNQVLKEIPGTNYQPGDIDTFDEMGSEWHNFAKVGAVEYPDMPISNWDTPFGDRYEPWELGKPGKGFYSPSQQRAIAWAVKRDPSELRGFMGPYHSYGVLPKDMSRDDLSAFWVSPEGHIDSANTVAIPEIANLHPDWKPQRKEDEWDFGPHFGAAEELTAPLPEPDPKFKRLDDPVTMADVQPWRLGEYGKFVGFPDGYVHSWVNQPNPYRPYHEDPIEARDGWPSHEAVAKAIGRPINYINGEQDAPNHTFGWISPKGEISVVDPWSDNATRHIDSVKKMHPGTHEEGSWTFAKAA